MVKRMFFRWTDLWPSIQLVECQPNRKIRVKRSFAEEDVTLERRLTRMNLFGNKFIGGTLPILTLS